MLQVCIKYTSAILQVCFNYVSNMLNIRFNLASSIIQACFSLFQAIQNIKKLTNPCKKLNKHTKIFLNAYLIVILRHLTACAKYLSKNLFHQKLSFRYDVLTLKTKFKKETFYIKKFGLQKSNLKK